MMLTTLPIISPVLRAAEVDLLWFGIIMIILLEAAQISPPQGTEPVRPAGSIGTTWLRFQEVADTGLRESGGNGHHQRRVHRGGCPSWRAWPGVPSALIIVFPEALALWLPDQIKGRRWFRTHCVEWGSAVGRLRPFPSDVATCAAVITLSPVDSATIAILELSPAHSGERVEIGRAIFLDSGFAWSKRDLS